MAMAPVYGLRHWAKILFLFVEYHTWTLARLSIVSFSHTPPRISLLAVSFSVLQAMKGWVGHENEAVLISVHQLNVVAQQHVSCDDFGSEQFQHFGCERSKVCFPWLTLSGSTYILPHNMYTVEVSNMSWLNYLRHVAYFQPQTWRFLYINMSYSIIYTCSSISVMNCNLKKSSICTYIQESLTANDGSLDAKQFAMYDALQLPYSHSLIQKLCDINLEYLT